jgi:uncharacterized membrane protein
MMPRIHIWILVIFVTLAFVTGGIVYPHIPNPAPVHWNWRGEADGFGSPSMDTFVVPGAMLFLAALMVFFPLVSSFKESFAKFSRILGRLAVTVIVCFFVIHCVLLLVALGWHVQVTRLWHVIVGLMIAIIGNWMGKIRRNNLIGIRTPWTLADDYVWNRTHRAGAWVMMGYGVAIALTGLWAPLWAGVVVTLAGAIGMLIWAMAFSSYVARHKPSAL